MAGVNMSLDEIIKASKHNKKGGRSVVRRDENIGRTFPKKASRMLSATSASRPPRDYAFTDRVPEGKWKHDMFAKVENEALRVNPLKRLSTGNPNKRVTLNVSNLDPAMIAAEDLEELFANFEVEEIVLHYDANGERIGTAAVTCRRSVANKIIEEYKNVRLDGRALKLAIVDDENGSASIKNRLDFGNLSGRVTKPIGRQGGGGGIRKRGGGGGAPKERRAFLDRVLDSDDEEINKSRGGPRFRKAGKGGAKVKEEPKSLEELDADLERYMNSGKAMEA